MREETVVDFWPSEKSSKIIAILFELQALKYICIKNNSLHVKSKHVWGQHPQPVADAFFKSVTRQGPCGGVTEMIKTCKKCWKVKDPGALCFENVWAGGLRALWLNVSHEPECNHSWPQLCSSVVGRRADAGELLPNTRGSSSLGEMEGLRERRGEHSFQALWRLAAVGRAAVFPKSPLNRKTVSFFPLHKSNLYPRAQSEGQLWTQTEEKKTHKWFY